MAKITKKDHARILQMVDTENRKVAEVASEYGCNPANIYALLGKLRRVAREQDAAPGKIASPIPAIWSSDAAGPPTLELQAPKQAATDLFAAVPETRPEPAPPTCAPTPETMPARPPATITELPRKAPIAKGSGIGAALAKPGFGLTMRTADGDESMTPFRSLEDLLSAVKPILRASARSQDAVWFSIQKIDLSMLEFDAA